MTTPKLTPEMLRELQDGIMQRDLRIQELERQNREQLRHPEHIKLCGNNGCKSYVEIDAELTAATTELQTLRQQNQQLTRERDDERKRLERLEEALKRFLPFVLP